MVKKRIYKGHSLVKNVDDLIDYFNLVKRNEHRALNDCVLTNQVYINLMNYLK